MLKRTVSVVIPSYNAAPTLRRSIDSVLAQTTPPHEVLVVDDGSTDNTAEVVREYGDRIRYYFQANQGLSGARNAGIRETSGEWLAFHDADDEWLSKKMEDQHALLDRYPDLVWCACNLEEVRRHRVYPGLIPDAVKRVLDEQGRAPFFGLVKEGTLFPAGAFLIRRSVFDVAGLFDVTLRTGGDRDMWWRIALRFPEIGYVARPGFRWYTGTPGSLSKINRDRSRGVRTVCDAALRARALSDQAWVSFAPYGRLLALDYQVREAGGEITVDRRLLRDLAQLFPPTFAERLMLTALRLVPTPIGKRIARRLRPRALAGRVGRAPIGSLPSC